VCGCKRATTITSICRHQGQFFLQVVHLEHGTLFCTILKKDVLSFCGFVRISVIFVFFVFSLGASDGRPSPTADPLGLPAADAVLLDLTISLRGAEHGEADGLIEKLAAKLLVLFSVGSVGVKILCDNCP